MKEVMIVHTVGTVRQYTVDDVQVHPNVLMLLQGDNRIIMPWQNIASCEVKINADDGGSQEN